MVQIFNRFVLTFRLYNTYLSGVLPKYAVNEIDSVVNTNRIIIKNLSIMVNCVN